LTSYSKSEQISILEIINNVSTKRKKLR